MNTRRIFVVLISGWLALAIFAAPGIAQQTQPPAQTSPAPRASVTLDGQFLFDVANFKAYSAEMRARRITGALKNVADDYTISPNVLTAVDDAISTDVMAGDQLVFSLVDGDAEGISRQELGNLVVKRIGPAIEKYRRDRAPKNLLKSVLYSLLATAAFITLMLVLIRANRKLMAWVRAHVRQVQVRSRELVRADWALHVVTGVCGPLRLIIVCGIVILYLNLVLSLFPWTRPFSLQILNYILVPLNVMADGFWNQVPSLLFIGVLSVVTYYLLRLTRFLFSEIEREKVTIAGFDPEWSRPTFNIVRVLVIACALIVAFPYIPGSGSLAFQGVSVFLGILLSLGSSAAVANMVAGILLTYMRAFKVGDVVSIGEASGVVTSVSVLVTHVRTFKKEEITIPNSMVLNTHVTNYSKAGREDGLILHASVSIGYNTPWRQVEALLLLAAERTPGLLSEPAPFVLQKKLDDFFVHYELNASTSDPQRMARTYSELHANIQDAFNEYGVQIMSPHYETDRDVPTFVPKEQWFTSPAKASPRTVKQQDKAMLR